MPFPILIAWALGAMATGAATGKGAQLVGDGKANKAAALIKSTEKYVSEKRSLFLSQNTTYLSRLESYSTLIFSLTGDIENIPNIGENIYPEYLSDFWEKINAPWSGGTGYEINSHVWKLTPSETNMMRGVVTYGKGHPMAQSATWAFLYAKKGISYALDANSSLEKVEAWSSEVKRSADAALDKLRKQYDDIGRDWDIQIVPHLKKALGPPRNAALISKFYAMGKSIESVARQRMEEASNITSGES